MAVVSAVVVLGPALGPGPLLDLDLLVTPRIPVPAGIWGLGPALSQRVPMFALFGLGSSLIGGPATVKLFLLSGIVAAFLGMVRLSRAVTGRLGGIAAGSLWAVGPFAVTRLAAGHIQFVWIFAVLPWVLPTLLRPSRRPPATFLALLMLAFGGPATGTIGLALAALGLLVEVSKRPVSVVTSMLVANLCWAAPTIVLLWAGAQVAGADRFPTTADGPSGWIGVLVGGGFWSPSRQIGATGPWAAAGAVILVAAAVTGRRRLRDRTAWGQPLFLAAVGGLALSLASAVPGVRSVYTSISALPIGAPLRESQRFLVLWLAWLAPAAAAGFDVVATRLRGRMRSSFLAGGADQVVRAAPLAVVLLLCLPGWWGAGGRLEPVDFPDGWEEARRFLAPRPGTAVALPWNEYPPLDLIDGRHAFNPLPDFLGGDVISSYDPLFDPGEPAQEQVDRRAWFLDRALRGDGPLGPAFTDVAARWAVVVHQPGWEAVVERIEAEPGAFRRVLRNDDVSIWEVRSWPGPAEYADGPSRRRRPVPPLVLTDAPPGSVLDIAGAPGWVRGWFRPTGVTESGLLRLPDAGGGPVWFWPAPVLLAIDATILVLAVRAWRERHGESGPFDGDEDPVTTR